MVQWFFFNEISCPLKGFCPEIFNFLLVEVFCPDELFDFLPEKASARDIWFSFLPEKRLLPEILFLSCPLKRLLHENIILFPARGKTFARIYFYLLPVGRLLPEILFLCSARLKASARRGYFLSCRWNGCCPSLSLSLRGSNSIRAGGAWVSVSLTSSRASEVSCVWPRYRSSSRGGALFNFSIFQVPTDSVFIKSLLSRIFSHRYMHTDGALSHFLSCANLLVHDWVLINLSVAEGRQKSFHCWNFPRRSH